MMILYLAVGLVGGILIGMAGLTAAMVVTPILSGICGWNGYNAVTMSLIANVPAAAVAAYTYFKNGNLDQKQGIPVSCSALAGAVMGSWLGYLFSRVSEQGVSYLVILGNLGMAVKFFLPAKQNKQGQISSQSRSERGKMMLALVLSFLIGMECGFMGSAGGVLMLMVLTLVLGMDTKTAVGTSGVVMALVALTGAVSHLAMGATVELLPAVVITAGCTLGAIQSAQFANRVTETVMNRWAGAILVVVSVLSLILE